MGGPVNDVVNNETESSSSVANQTSGFAEGVNSLPAAPYSNKSTANQENSDQSEGEGKGKSTPIKMPFDLGTVKTVKEALDALKELRINSIKIIDVVKNSEDIAADLSSLEMDKDATESIMGKLLGSDKGEDAELDDETKFDLETLSETYVTSFEPAFDDVKKKGSTTYDKLGSFQKLDANTGEMKALMQQAYQNNDSSMLKKIEDFLGTVEYYNEKGKSFSSTAGRFSSKIKDSKLLTHLDGVTGEVGSFLDKGNAMLDRAKKLNEAYEAMGGQSESVEGPVKGLKLTMDMVDGMINLLDLPGLNMIQVMWNNFYKPMIDICIEGLFKLASHVKGRVKDLLQLHIREWNSHKGDHPPTIRYLQEYLDSISIPKEVFDFMWYTMKGLKTNLNQTIIDYFEDNYDRIDAGTKTMLPYEGFGPMWNLDLKSFRYWASKEKFSLWSLFFGVALPHPPGTK